MAELNDTQLQNHAKLMKKMANVIKKTGNVEKKGTNKDQNYKFATHSDVIEELRQHIADEGLFILPKPGDFTEKEVVSRSGGKGKNILMQMHFEIIDTDTGYSVEARWYGEGMDYGDKAFYKAYTGALKYFLLDTFQVPTGDDPENEAPEKQAKPTPPQRPAQSPVNRPPIAPVQYSMTAVQRSGIMNLLAAKGQSMKSLADMVKADFKLFNWERMSFAQANLTLKKLRDLSDIDPDPNIETNVDLSEPEVDPDEAEAGIAKMNEEKAAKESETK